MGADMTYPRDELAKYSDEEIARALEPLAWSTIKARIAQLDHCAMGGVSLDATLIAALALRLFLSNRCAQAEVPHG